MAKLVNKHEYRQYYQERDDVGEPVVEEFNHRQSGLSGAANRIAHTRHSGGNFARRCVEIVDVIKGFKFALGNSRERPLYGLDDVEKTDAPVEEGMDRRLVGCVEHRGTSAATKQSLPRDPQRRKTALVGQLESETTNRRQVEPLGWRLDAVRPGKRIGDWGSHIG